MAVYKNHLCAALLNKLHIYYTYIKKKYIKTNCNTCAILTFVCPIVLNGYCKDQCVYI